MRSEIRSAVFTTNVTLTTITEEVCVTLDNLSVADSGASILLFGWVQVTSGLGATALTAKIEEGSAAGGTVVGEGNAINVNTAGHTQDLYVSGIDSPGDVASQSYVLTVTQTGATGNGTALQGALVAIITG